MCAPAPWMAQLDERILEQLADGGDTIAWEIGTDLVGPVSCSRVIECWCVLAEAGLVEREDRDLGFGRFETFWSITTWGRQFLGEEVDPGLDVPVPKPRPPHATRSGWCGVLKVYDRV